jgi:hypothetical protein
MQKNVANQKWTVFAFDLTDNTPKTGLADITAKLSKDGAAGAALNDVSPVELESGYYEFDLTQAETDFDKLTIIPVSQTADIQVVGSPGTLFTTPVGFPDNVGATEAKQDEILSNFFPDEVFDPSLGTIRYNKKGTVTQLSKKDLKDPSGNAVDSTEDIIAEATEQ